MANQADGSIIVDTELNSEGFKAGSAELLAAIKSLSNEVKTLGQTLKETFGGSDKSVGATDGKVQALEATIASLQAQVKSLQDTVATLQEKLDALNSGKTEQTPLDGVSDAAKGADEQVTALEAKIKELEGVIAGMQTQLDAAASAPSEVDFDTDAAEAKISALENKVSELERTIADLQNGGGGTAAPAVDFGGAPQKASSLQKQIDAVNSSVDRLGPTFQRAMGGSESAMTSFRSKAESLNGEIGKLEQQLQAVGEAQIPTQEYQNVSAELEKAEEKFNSLLAKQEKMQAMGVSMDSNQWKSMQYDMELVSDKYHELLSLKRQLEESGGAYVAGTDTAQYAQMESALSAATQQLQYMESEIDRVNSKWAQMPTFTGYIRSAISSIGSTIKSTFSGIGTVITHPLQSADRLLGAMVQKAGQFVRTTAKFAVSKLTSGLKSAAASMAKMVTHGRSMNSQFSGLISGAKKFTLSLLGARGVYALLRKAVSAYMQENEQLSATLSACWSGIGNILGPIITRIVNLVATATAYVTKFLNLLGFVGKSTKKEISKAGGAAKKESDELKRYLASFDELNILGDKNSDSDSGGADTDVSAELPNVELPDWVKLMVDQLKSGQWAEAAKTLTGKLNDMVSSVDWAGIGSKIGYYLNGALTFLATAITTFDWYNLGASLGELINNVIYGVDWANLGIVLGWKIIALIEGLGGLFATIDWAALGKALADAFMGLWNAIDWVQAAKTLSDGLIGALNALSSAIKNVDWQKLGRDIATFIANIDWGGVTTALFDGIGAALGGLTAFLWGLIQDAWQSVVDWWYDVAYEDGSFTIEGLLEGIWNAICNIGQWIVDHIFTPFINGFKDAFGVHSPSTVMAEQGGFIIDGLLQGITAAWDAITKFFGDALSSLGETLSTAWSNIKEGASKAWTKVSDTVCGAWDSVKSWTSDAAASVKQKASDAWDKVKSGASTAWSNVSSTVSSAWNNIKSWCSSSGSDVEGNTSSVWSGVKATIATQMEGAETLASTAWGYMKDTASNTGTLIKAAVSGDWGSVKDTISAQINNTKTAAATAWAAIKTTTTTTGANIKSTVSSAWNNIKSVSSSAWTAISSTLSSKWSSISSTVSSKVSSIKSAASNGFNNIKSDITSKMSSALSSIKGLGWSGVGSAICSGIGNGINSGWNWLSNKVSSLANSLLRAAKSALGIHSPSRVFRDIVGLNIGYGIGEGIENSEGSVVRTVSSVADAIAEEFNSNTYSFGDISADSNAVRGLDSFSTAITDSFNNLIDRLQAIADRVTFSTPAILNGAVPYSAATTAERTSKGGSPDNFTEFSSDVDERLSDLSYQLKQILAVLKALNLNIDLDALADAITQQQRSKLRNFGGV